MPRIAGAHHNDHVTREDEVVEIAQEDQALTAINRGVRGERQVLAKREVEDPNIGIGCNHRLHRRNYTFAVNVCRIFAYDNVEKSAGGTGQRFARTVVKLAVDHARGHFRAVIAYNTQRILIYIAATTIRRKMGML